MPGIVVVGGGAAGMMAAVAAADAGAKVRLFEKNEKLGKKLFITGKGRCNVTNAADIETLFENVCTNAKFLYSAFYRYGNREVMDFLERAGCPLKVERGDRVFPVSDHSSDVIAAFGRELKRSGVEVCLNTAVREIVTAVPCLEAEKSGDEKNMAHASAAAWGVRLSDGRVIPADAVIVCTGGLSYPATGSDGDGLRFAEGLGHRVTACKPSLVPLEAEEKWCRELMGLSLKNVSLTMAYNGKIWYKEQGEMLFTHFGVSGPLVLSASCYYHKALAKSKPSGSLPALFIDLKPALDEEQLDRRLLRDFQENRNKQFKNALGGLFPAKLIPVMVRLSGIGPDKKVHEVSREERRQFGRLIKNLPLTVTGTRSFAEAVITQGGVAVAELNPSTMESRKVKGLYFAGEVLDVDARTGGFNLQIAWSTGYLAGKSAACP